MALPRPVLLLVLLLLSVACACAAHSAPLDADWGLARIDFEDDELMQTCDGTVSECADKDDEDRISAEAEYVDIRRGLAAAYPGRMRFISYGMLTKNRVPCSRRGHSYYNCFRRRRANPYRRGCSIITMCARILH